jgi:hypothetical protein
MSCKTCSDLQFDIELAARDFSRAVQESRGIHAVSGYKIDEAERKLRVASRILDMHREHCDRAKSA